MNKVHLLFKKEEIDKDKMTGKIAVIFDVLLATSTIVSGLFHGAKEVVPVIDQDAAKKEARGRNINDYILVGEYEGKTIDGFLDPIPLYLKKHIQDKTMILSTTNGTVAIKRSANAKKQYICSLLNGKATALDVNETLENESIIIICSGSSNHFCMEDFYGAGYFLSCLVNENGGEYNLSDAALAALHFYRNADMQALKILQLSRVGQQLSDYEEEIRFVASKGTIPVVATVNQYGAIIQKHIN